MRPLRQLALVATLCLCACNGDDETEPAPPTESSCLPPNRVVGDACIEPGVQDDGCPAGTLGLDDGSCRPAGIIEGECGQGFVHDGDVGCDPILPAESCPPGRMAVPGDAECRPVMECGEGRWGDIPIEPSTEHVDASYVDGGSDGSAARAAAFTAAKSIRPPVTTAPLEFLRCYVASVR